jgi:hypothetical protein
MQVQRDRTFHGESGEFEVDSSNGLGEVGVSAYEDENDRCTCGEVWRRRSAGDEVL